VNCLLGALLIRYRVGGALRYRLPTSSCPWGHWWVEKGGWRISWSALDKRLPVWRMLWFEGRIRRK